MHVFLIPFRFFISGFSTMKSDQVPRFTNFLYPYVVGSHSLPCTDSLTAETLQLEMTIIYMYYDLLNCFANRSYFHSPNVFL